MIKRRWSIIGGNAKSDAAFQWRGILIPAVKKTTTLGKRLANSPNYAIVKFSGCTVYRSGRSESTGSY
jgi:hypothetical protein